MHITVKRWVGGNVFHASMFFHFTHDGPELIIRDLLIKNHQGRRTFFLCHNCYNCPRTQLKKNAAKAEEDGRSLLILLPLCWRKQQGGEKGRGRKLAIWRFTTVMKPIHFPHPFLSLSSGPVAFSSTSGLATNKRRNPIKPDKASNGESEEGSWRSS